MDGFYVEVIPLGELGGFIERWYEEVGNGFSVGFGERPYEGEMLGLQ